MIAAFVMILGFQALPGQPLRVRVPGYLRVSARPGQHSGFRQRAGQPHWVQGPSRFLRPRIASSGREHPGTHSVFTVLADKERGFKAQPHSQMPVRV